MAALLPTFVSPAWTQKALRDSFANTLTADVDGTHLRLFSYAVTDRGWQEMQKIVKPWQRKQTKRITEAYIGTDHALTDPEALKAMLDDGVQVYVMVRYQGIYHPKLMWMEGPKKNVIWIGSNNLTQDGLLHNIEFATVNEYPTVPAVMQDWHTHVHSASDLLTDELLKNYRTERNAYGASRAGVGTFTWSKKKEPLPAPPPKKVPKPSPLEPKVGEPGDLVVEVMPLETGIEGKQMQLPKEAAIDFFGTANHIGASRQIHLVPKGTTAERSLTMTIFGNNSVRLSVNELDYRDRPCVIVFHPLKGGRIEFEIVQRSIYPSRHAILLTKCDRQTRTGSRRWGII